MNPCFSIGYESNEWMNHLIAANIRLKHLHDSLFHCEQTGHQSSVYLFHIRLFSFHVVTSFGRTVMFILVAPTSYEALTTYLKRSPTQFWHWLCWDLSSDTIVVTIFPCFQVYRVFTTEGCQLMLNNGAFSNFQLIITNCYHRTVGIVSSSTS